MTDVSKYVGKQRTDIRKQHFKNIIAQDPKTVMFRGEEYTVRFSQPQHSKIIQYAGFKNKELVAECYIIMNEASPIPDKLYPLEDSSTGKKYQIIDFQKDYGDFCYILNLESKK